VEVAAGLFRSGPPNEIDFDRQRNWKKGGREKEFLNVHMTFAGRRSFIVALFRACSGPPSYNSGYTRRR